MPKVIYALILTVLSFMAASSESRAQMLVTDPGVQASVIAGNAQLGLINSSSQRTAVATVAIERTQGAMQAMFTRNSGTNLSMYNPVAARNMIESMPATDQVNRQVFFGDDSIPRGISFGARVYSDHNGAFQGAIPNLPGGLGMDEEARVTLKELAGTANIVQMAQDNLDDLDKREEYADDSIKMVNSASNITEATVYSGRLVAENNILLTQMSQAVNLSVLAQAQSQITAIDEAATQRKQRQDTLKLLAFP
ncbi:hypothetical protein ELG72_37335 [Rhizobium leguminosarum]|uniref:hypothetical protein n=1 Tax=Rhizobium TaxID=379 RepID=UPI00103102EE|nr:hypothetical protein [Rhizobium leguminosarum]TBF87507.1 hypothetical protein ELG82_38075 [Rhizobium leguminosarum]TBG06983.1 hypothetical protein ELG80_37850 [Rhizobium leguminosarum]TBG07854.1 hypothetical protein ELG81_37235 [Rhizobium leguminosarum]TBG30020.1 hypothetical protein ELG75_37920 [Rhizobium leguminosarum]TBG50153.1 hypothetical protein ELG72_37335 [Rhizobium leguminosarum]